MQVTVSEVVSSSAAVAPGVVNVASGSELPVGGSFAPVTKAGATDTVSTEDSYHPSSPRREADVYSLERQRSDSESSEEDVALSADELDQLRQLKERDQDVRAHEQAHASVGGVHAGSMSFTYQVGPDGVRYAIGGEVNVDVSPVANDPQATIDKMAQIQRAALAPAEPSAQDRKVAAQAGQQAAKALADLSSEQQSSRSGEIQRLEAEREDIKAEMDKAREEQKAAEEKEDQEEAVSAAERFAEYNAKLRQINEVLLRISMPSPISAGQILDDLA